MITPSPVRRLHNRLTIFLLALLFHVTIPLQAVEITSPLNVTAALNDPDFSYQITVDRTVGTAIYTVAPTSDVPGLEFGEAPATGKISGTLTESGVYTIGIIVIYTIPGLGVETTNAVLILTVTPHVNNTSDSGDGSLRQAIANVSAGITPVIDPSISGQTIILTSGPLIFGKSVHIDGAGLVIDGNGATTNARTLEIGADANVMLSSVTITGGAAADQGGGILVHTGGELTLSRATVSGNNAAISGGGIHNEGTLTLLQSTIAENTVSNEAGSQGGGLFNDNEAHIRHSTISANTAHEGGGIAISSAGILTEFENTIVAGNTGTTAPDVLLMTGGTIDDAVGNLIGNHGSVEAVFPLGATVGNAANPVDPLLAPLANNGGSTATMRLLGGSPALDAGAGGSDFDTDQRGFERVLGAGPDIGAYESVAGGYTAQGLTLFAKLDPGQPLPVEFEISQTPDFQTLAQNLAGTGEAGFLDAPSMEAKFHHLSGIAKDAEGNLFIADTANNRIRMRSADGTITTIAGSGDFGFLNGAGTDARFAFPAAIAVDANGDLFVADTFNHSIRKISRPITNNQPWTVTTLAGSGAAGNIDGSGGTARFSHPQGLAVDASGAVYVADSGNHAIRLVNQTGGVTTLPLTAPLNAPLGLALDSAGDLYIADSGNHLIRKIDTGTGVMTTVAGETLGFADGAGALAQFQTPAAIAVDQQDHLYVADKSNHAIRKVVPRTGTVTTVAGSGDPGSDTGVDAQASFNCPVGLLIDEEGAVLVADSLNHRIRRVRADFITVAAVAGDLADGQQCISASVNFVPLALEPATTYYVRWHATANGVRQGIGQSFTTPAQLIEVTPFQLWQTAQFGDDAGNPLVAGADADPNGDGISNLFNYGIGRSPFDGSTNGLPAGIFGEAEAQIDFSKNLAATDVVYVFEWSDDMDTWTEVAATEQILSTDGDTQLLRAVIATDGLTRKFIRLNIRFSQP